MQACKPRKRIGGHSIGHFHIREQPGAQVCALQYIVAENPVFRKTPAADCMKRFNID